MKKVAIEIILALRGFKFLFVNGFVARLPFHVLRLFFYRLVLKKVGKNSSILRKVEIREGNIEIGNNTVINQHCVLDGRCTLRIGNNVDIAPYVKIWTVEHDPNSPLHLAVNEAVNIHDNVWIASGATILPGVTIGEGAVVAANALVTKNVEPYTIVAGVPAKEIGKRNTDIQYKHYWRPWFE